LTQEFDYHLPPELIAQTPIEPRDASRLLVVQRATGALAHRHFRDILEYLRAGDLLVVNETRVIPARLHARKLPSGGKVELLLLARREGTLWEALVKGRAARVGQMLELEGPAGAEPCRASTLAALRGVVEGVTPAGGRLIRFEQPIEGAWARLGSVPRPPYIHQPLANPERYQTVYARVQGSVAAPTAGLHFTPELIARSREMGVAWAAVNLNIGLDTFRPVTVERVEEHHIHTEQCQLSLETAHCINAARAEGRRVIAVGTTAVRVLESAADETGGVRPWDGPTSLFIYPGYRYRVVDALITNFHLPRSSLLMLVSALAGPETIQRAYAEAIRERYRFFSFGDAMLIL
jgi:S-adenosylmethionine:tRNA ribosyltransferase-isomerase